MQRERLQQQQQLYALVQEMNDALDNKRWRRLPGLHQQVMRVFHDYAAWETDAGALREVKSKMHAAFEALITRRTQRPEKAAISAPTTSTSGSTFSLPQAGLNAVAERLIGAKVNQQQASAAGHQRDDADPAAMQALLAMLLAQPAQASASAPTQKQPDGEMLKMLAQVQTSQSGSSLLRQLAGAMAQQGKTSSPSAEPHATDLSSLPPNLQT